jgi:hypothetical protein
MSTTQTITQQAPSSADKTNEISEQKTRNLKRKKINFPKRKAVSVAYKRKDYDFHRKHLGITIPPEAEIPKTIVGKNGKSRKVKPRPPKEVILAQRYYKAKHYRSFSTNRARSFPYTGTLKKSLQHLFKFVAEKREKILPSPDGSGEPEEVRIQETSLYRVRNGLNMFLSPILDVSFSHFG